ncbi:hypothetical protein E2320_007255, partial [Naja naja]
MGRPPASTPKKQRGNPRGGHGQLLCEPRGGLAESGPAARPLLRRVLPMIRFGHIPNGGRVYYERRSQPPLLSLMMESYLSHTNDT